MSIQAHASAGRDNSERAGTEEDPGWSVPGRIWVENCSKNVGEGA